MTSDRPGYLKEVTAVFGEMRINITYLQGQADNRAKLSSVSIHSDDLPAEKLQKLLVKLKKLIGTKEVSYKVSR